MGKSKELAELGDVFTQSGGNVGIGESSPARNLVVKDSTMASIALQTDASGSTLTDGFQLQADSNDAYVWNYENTDMLLGTNNTTRMTIDASGRVTKPYTPSFMAAKSSHQTASGTVVFDDVDFNVGNHYNGSTGLFTAPVAGVYLFTFSTLIYSMGGSTRAQLLVNGTAAGSQTSMGTYGAFTGSYAGQGASMVYKLSANDVVQIYCHHSTTNFHSYYTWWSGYQLG